MTKQYPLFPLLSEEGEIEAQKLIDAFKVKITKVIKDVTEETIGELYCDIVPYIGSDSWINYRNDLMDGFKDYNNRKIQGDYDFKEIRQTILKEHQVDIIKDLNQDMLEKIKKQKETIEFLQNVRHSY